MSTHNIYFHGKIRKILSAYTLLSGAMPTAHTTGMSHETQKPGIA